MEIKEALGIIEERISFTVGIIEFKIQYGEIYRNVRQLDYEEYRKFKIQYGEI